ncbi:sensor histidine kinase [Paenibacillus jiagnxiensis]|uniref:sensor histidine kinase n=1 Tax=Paenibacillus jiagnxiensis TaxID=3228926 RepID=UPI0033B13444
MKNPFKIYRIDRLFFLGFALFLIVVLGCAVWASYTISSRELAATSSYYQQQLLNEVNNELSARLTTIEQISLSTSRDQELIDLLSGSSSTYEHYRKTRETELSLQTLTYSIPLIQGIDLYMNNPFSTSSQEGYIHFRSLQEAPGQSWYPLVEQGDFTWSGEYTVPSVQGDVPVMSFVRKIVYDDKYLGILAIHVKAGSIKNILSGDTPGTNRVMLDSSGRQLLAVGEVPGQALPAGRTDEMTEANGVLRLNGEAGMNDTLLVYSKVDNSHWVLVQMTPWEQITAGSRRLAEVIGLIGLTAVLLTSLLALWLSKQFTRPLKQLIGAMKRFSIGDKEPMLPEDYRNEFGQLFSGYRQQNERINQLYQSLQQRLEQQRRAEIKALQANINPHFLYNTLDQLNWMAIERGQERISRILELMGRMFRIGLSNGESFITLEEEADHIRCYLEIQQIRWESGLNFSIELPDAARNLYVPKMTLQPFVENCIVHGFNGRDHGFIRICVQEDGERVLLTVEDDGRGLHSASTERNRTNGGYGIRNVRERIDAYFGSTYGVALSNRTEGGTRAIITLPHLAERPQQEA